MGWGADCHVRLFDGGWRVAKCEIVCEVEGVVVSREGDMAPREGFEDSRIRGRAREAQAAGGLAGWLKLGRGAAIVEIARGKS